MATSARLTLVRLRSALLLVFVLPFIAACAAASPDGGPTRIGLALPRGLDAALDWRIVAEGPSGQEIVETFDPNAPAVRLENLEAGVWTIKADGINSAAGTLVSQGVASATVIPGETADAELVPGTPAPFRISGTLSPGALDFTNAHVAILYLMSGTEIVEANLAESYPPGFRTGPDPEMNGTFDGTWYFELPRLPENRDWWVLALVSGGAYAEAVFLSTEPLRAGYHDLADLNLRADIDFEHWARINFNANGGDTTSQTVYHRPGESLTLPTAAEFTRTGALLLGWSTNSLAMSPDYSPGATVTAGSANTTYYAIWQLF